MADLRPIIERFWKSMPARAGALKPLVASACRAPGPDREALRSELHKMKGELALLKIEPLAELVARAYALVRTLPTNASSSALRDALDALLAELERERDAGARDGAGPTLARSLDAARAALGLGPWEEVLR